MRQYTGNFKNLKGDTITVSIYCKAEDGEAVSMGAEGDSIMFQGEDTVEIESEVNDTFDHLIQHSATIRLLVKEDQPQFFCADCRQVQVIIKKNDTCVFAGYVEPQAYQQEYDETWDELELSCIDVISATQYHNYHDLTTSTYDDYLANADSISLIDLIRESLYGKTDGVDSESVISYGTTHLYYDKSVGLDADSVATIFSDTYLDEALILGESLDDIWTQQDTLSEVMQWLNLRLIQQGFDFYIYSLESVKNLTSIEFIDLLTNETKTIKSTIEDLSGTMSNSLSREEIFNQIKVKAELTDVDTVIENPLDSDDLYSVYSAMERYCREMVSWAEGEGAHEAFYYMIRNLEAYAPYGDGCSVEDWWLRLFYHPQWKCAFPNTGYGQGYDMQQYLFSGYDGTFFKRKGGFIALNADSSVLSKATKYLVLAVDYQGEQGITPSWEDIEYNSSQSATNLVPVEGTTNYLVIKGSMMFTAKKSENYTQWRYPNTRNDIDGSNAIASRTLLDASYYAVPRYQKPDDQTNMMMTCAFYKNGTAVDMESMIPPCDEHLRKIEKESAEVEKVAILMCFLQIGDHYLSEINGELSWSTNADSRFNIYVSIDKDGYLIGDWHSIYNMNEDMQFDDEGMLIPITSTDNISGKVTFRIESGDDVLFDSKYLWQYTDCCFIKDFEIKVVSDNANQDQTLDNDLLYMTAEDETYQNDKEITMKINSALTTGERAEMRMEGKVLICNPYKADGTKITEVYSARHGETNKPETFYIDCAYREHSQPKVQFEVEQDAEASSHGEATYFKRWKSNIKNIELFPFAVSENLQTGRQTFKIKENNTI